MGKRTNRIAVFVDHDNFKSGYLRQFRVDEMSFEIWENLNDRLMNLYAHFFPFPERLDHIGTWITLALIKSSGKKFKEKISDIDRLQKFIVKYGFRKNFKEKAVDTEIVCQMLMGAVRDEYDVSMILSDDADYIPAVHRIQDMFGKRVIQVGFEEKSKLRAACFGHVPLECGTAELSIN
ncbi:MAG: NYN domain-containing protein [Bacteroidota bacterium]